MTAEVRIVRTEAETAIVDAYERVRGSLPGGQLVAKRRDAAFEIFRKVGLPHRRIEEWKYTDLRALMRKVAPPAARPTIEVARKAISELPDPLAGLDRYKLVLVDGFFFDELSDRDALLRARVEVEPTANLLAMDGEKAIGVLDSGKLAGRDIAVALNAAFATDGVNVVVPAGVVLDKPLELQHVSTGAGGVTVRNTIAISGGGLLRIVETHRGPSGAPYQTNILTRIDAGANTTVGYARLQAEGDRAVHIGTTVLALAAPAEFKHLSVTAGSAVSRSQIFLTTGGERTKVGLFAANMIGVKQHADSTLLIDHALPGANTRVLYKVSSTATPTASSRARSSSSPTRRRPTRR